MCLIYFLFIVEFFRFSSFSALYFSLEFTNLLPSWCNMELMLIDKLNYIDKINYITSLMCG